MQTVVNSGKEDESIASPTVSVEVLFTPLVIDAMEGISITVFDIPGAFLQPEMPGDNMMFMPLRGGFMDVMSELSPEHLPNVTYDNKGRKVLHVKCIWSIYGCIETAILWYELYSSTLNDLGFKINLYDRCVSNVVINGK